MSTAMRTAFRRIDEEYGGPPPGGGPFGPGEAGGASGEASGGASSGAAGGVAVDGGAGGRGGGGWRGGSGGGGWGGGAGGPLGGGAPAWASPDAHTRFSATRAYDKLISLATLALVSGVIGWFAVSGPAAAGLMLVAFVLVIAAWFRMRWARYIAPAYSVCEGLALGAVSKAYSSLGHGIVPSAIVFTAGVFVGALVLYRTGLVRVTHRMMSLAFMGALGILAVGLLSLLGLPVPGVDTLTGAGLVFSVLALGIAILNLFTDFAYVSQAEAMGVSSDGEWPAAFAMMTAVVLVYISMLRILGAAYGGGGRRR